MACRSSPCPSTCLACRLRSARCQPVVSLWSAVPWAWLSTGLLSLLTPAQGRPCRMLSRSTWWPQLRPCSWRSPASVWHCRAGAAATSRVGPGASLALAHPSPPAPAAAGPAPVGGGMCRQPGRFSCRRHLSCRRPGRLGFALAAARQHVRRACLARPWRLLRCPATRPLTCGGMAQACQQAAPPKARQGRLGGAMAEAVVVVVVTLEEEGAAAWLASRGARGWGWG